ncbi:MAG: beta-galactosidase, partial [Armatimonadota bacterium]
GRHSIRTNLFVAGAHPFYTDEKLFAAIISQGRFANNPFVWAYDIAWEHHLGNHDERRRWDREWEDWIIERYGTIEHAEAVWGYAIPRDANGRITNPSDDQLSNDGPWLKMVAAYERCADDVISRRYARVIQKIRALDPNHLISARSASQPSWTHWFAYDLVSCGKHFDFASPEGYGLQPEEAGFTTAYARYAGNGKPVFWAELGSSIYPYDTTGEKAKSQAELCAGFAKMLVDSGANGMAVWWSVGGYRVDERSDFGIIAPDGTPRPSAVALRKLALLVTSPRKPRTRTVWVTVDRDLHAAGYTAVYEANKQAYVDAVRRGMPVRVRTEGTSTTSATCPLTSVGNVPYDGFSPLKYLNAEFYRVEILTPNGSWREVSNGETVTVPAGKPVTARVWAGNTGDARWLSGSGTGAVSLVGDSRADANSSQLPRLEFAVPVPKDVPRYSDVFLGPFRICDSISQDCEVVFTFEAAGRAKFGERFPIRLMAR